jgi:hypothetical protein
MRRLVDMKLREWLNVEILVLTARHCTGSLIVILLFSFTTWVAERVVFDVIVLAIIHYIDRFVVVACIAWLALVMLWELGLTLWRLVKNGDKAKTNATLGE